MRAKSSSWPSGRPSPESFFIEATNVSLVP